MRVMEKTAMILKWNIIGFMSSVTECTCLFIVIKRLNYYFDQQDGIVFDLVCLIVLGTLVTMIPSNQNTA